MVTGVQTCALPISGVELAKENKIQGVGVAHNKDTEYLKSIPDGTEDNNLSHLPTVHG